MTPLPPDLAVPPYGSASLADVLPGAAAAVGVDIERGDLPADPLDLRARCRRARRVLVLLVDGLGADLLRAHADLAPTLAGLASPVGDLSAPCPSTTPVSLATLGTGLPPGSHGILGFVTDVPGADRTLNHVQWADDPDPAVWQARPTVFELAEAAGVPTTAVGPYAYAGSGLTRAVYRGAAYTGAVSHGDLCALALRALAATTSGPGVRLHPGAGPDRARPRRRLGELAGAAGPGRPGGGGTGRRSAGRRRAPGDRRPRDAGRARRRPASTSTRTPP